MSVPSLFPIKTTKLLPNECAPPLESSPSSFYGFCLRPAPKVTKIGQAPENDCSKMITCLSWVFGFFSSLTKELRSWHMVSRLFELGIVYINTSWAGISYFFIPTASYTSLQKHLANFFMSLALRFCCYSIKNCHQKGLWESSVSFIALPKHSQSNTMICLLRLLSLYKNAARISAMGSSLRLCLRITKNLVILAYERREGLFKRVGNRGHVLRSSRSLRKVNVESLMEARKLYYCHSHFRSI